MSLSTEGIGEHEGSDPVSVGPSLRMLLPVLTPAEQTVVEWLLRKENFIESPTISEAAKILGVSQPLLVKVARRLGYSGFKTLRSAVMAYHNLPQIGMDQDLSRDDSIDEIKRKIFQATRQVLDEVQSITPPDVIGEAARIFYEGRQRGYLWSRRFCRCLL